MRKYLRTAALVLPVIVSSGCMGLSLFTSRHTHYHGGAEMEKRVEALEEQLEQQDSHAAEQ